MLNMSFSACIFNFPYPRNDAISSPTKKQYFLIIKIVNLILQITFSVPLNPWCKLLLNWTDVNKTLPSKLVRVPQADANRDGTLKKGGESVAPSAVGKADFL